MENFIVNYFLKLAHNSHQICALTILFYSLDLVIFTLEFRNRSLKFLPATIIIIIFIPLSSSTDLLTIDTCVYYCFVRLLAVKNNATLSGSTFASFTG